MNKVEDARILEDLNRQNMATSASLQR